MPVEYHAVHEKVREKEGATWGCWNRPRPKYGSWVVSTFANTSWPYVFSTECRNDHSLTDAKCIGCEHVGSGERYDQEVRSKGK